MRGNRSPWSEADIEKVRSLAAQGIPARAIGSVVGRSEDAVFNLKKKIPGLTFTARFSRKDNVPDDFRQHAYDPCKKLQRRYQTGHATITAWREQLGITPAMLRAHVAKTYKPVRKKMPEGFAEYQEGRTIAEIKAHFRISDTTIRRFCAELGINRWQQYNEARAAQKAQRKAAKPAPKPATSTVDRSAFIATGTVDRPHIDITPAGQAAEYLRRFGPVVRCDERGRYDPAGNRWRRGSALLTAEEIIDRAVRNGWRNSSGLLAA